LKQGKLSTHKQNLRYEEAMFGSDDEDEDDDKAFVHLKKANKPKRSDTWIKEGKGDEPLDFLDPKIISKVVSTDPRKFKRDEENNSDFEVGDDGKLMVDDEDENDDEDEDEDDMMKDEDEDEDEVGDVKKNGREEMSILITIITKMLLQ